MDYGPDDSSGTDDDLPPFLHNTIARGGYMSGNGRPIVGAVSYPRLQNDMETQIHHIEQEAYSSVLLAFKARSDAITWEKESLITELRKELRVSDKEHRELLGRVNVNDIIQRIREWRQTSRRQSGMLADSQPDVVAASPIVSASHKRQKVSQPIPSFKLVSASPIPQSQSVASIWPTSSAAKAACYRNQKQEVYISAFFVEISPEDTRRDGNGHPNIVHRLGQGASGRRAKMTTANCGVVPGVGRGRGSLKNQKKKDFSPAQNGIEKITGGIEILRTESIIKEVEKLLNASHPDTLEIEKAKKLLKDHEQSLADAIARLDHVSDVESKEADHEYF